MYPKSCDLGLADFELSLRKTYDPSPTLYHLKKKKMKEKEKRNDNDYPFMQSFTPDI